MESIELIWWIIAAAMMIGGLAGTVLPLLPSTPLIFAGIFLLAWQDNFTHSLGWPSLTILFFIMLVSALLDYIAGAMGAKRAGASPYAVWGALIGSVVGIAGGMIGLILGPFIGAAAGEWYARRDVFHAGKVGIASGLGMLIGAIAKIGLAIAMIGVFALAWFF